ncbi:hypothetical protein BGM26_04095 [Bacillus sp. FJAT-29790]|uniref:hypothetical protein n=1 Tax=Bacillus sp. FJAT-29790 TaxID=1895002 RepID=UPI001C2302BC|nr:hypothetical protein [Bacillus sp. FJAT-29790]MBU8878174.1 hypothetical protein [Bacillus sp. FJAT-29790]
MIPENKWKPGSQSGIDVNFLNIPGVENATSEFKFPVGCDYFTIKGIIIRKDPITVSSYTKNKVYPAFKLVDGDGTVRIRPAEGRPSQNDNSYTYKITRHVECVSRLVKKK